jgi:glyoxylase-like metal-dependent hydrolase (beta-lactamase superfamily II)
MRRALVTAFVVAAATMGTGDTSAAQSAGGEATPPAIHVEPVQKNIYLLASAGSGNITVQVGSEGVLMVDSGIDRSAPQVLAAIQKLSTGRVRYIINTHAHPDHVGGNGAFGKLAGPDPADALKIVGQQNVLNRLTHPAAGQPRFPEEGLPYDEYSTAFKSMYFNGEAVLVYHEPNAHTDGDSVVMFRGSDVISTGDIFTPGAYPFIDLERGGSVQGEIAALNHLLDLAVPARTQEGGTYIVPGHGRICDEADLVEFRDMIVIVRDRVRDLIGKGLTLEQVKAARPSRDYDTEYVSNDSFVSADRFVESVYTSLRKAASR